MKNLFIDLTAFLKSLTIIDYVLYFAILVLIILVASLIYLLKTTTFEEDEIIEETSDNDFDIKTAVKELATEEKKPVITFTDYEKEQEEKAIISYDELIERKNQSEIDYETDEMLDDEVSVKKINLEHLNKAPEEKKSLFVHEEEFLEALKQLQKSLN